MKRMALATALAAALTVSKGAHAEQSIIGHPGDHPRYTVELEPHALFAYGFHGSSSGAPGLGFRGTVILVQDGFVKSINNSVGLGLGVDVSLSGSAAVDVPLVMQWNFFLSTHWSVFGEPGIGLEQSGSSYVHPIFAAGGRYHFNDWVTLTLRVGYPAISVGASFLL